MVLIAMQGYGQGHLGLELPHVWLIGKKIYKIGGVFGCQINKVQKTLYIPNMYLIPGFCKSQTYFAASLNAWLE